jgi:hypothetical protein
MENLGDRKGRSIRYMGRIELPEDEIEGDRLRERGSRNTRIDPSPPEVMTPQRKRID